MKRVGKDREACQKTRGRLGSRLYVAWLALVCHRAAVGGRLDGHAGAGLGCRRRQLAATAG